MVTQFSSWVFLLVIGLLLKATLFKFGFLARLLNWLQALILLLVMYRVCNFVHFSRASSMFEIRLFEIQSSSRVSATGSSITILLKWFLPMERIFRFWKVGNWILSITLPARLNFSQVVRTLSSSTSIFYIFWPIRSTSLHVDSSSPVFYKKFLIACLQVVI